MSQCISVYHSSRRSLGRLTVPIGRASQSQTRTILAKKSVNSLKICETLTFEHTTTRSSKAGSQLLKVTMDPGTLRTRADPVSDLRHRTRQSQHLQIFASCTRDIIFAISPGVPTQVQQTWHLISPRPKTIISRYDPYLTRAIYTTPIPTPFTRIRPCPAQDRQYQQPQ